MIATYLRDISKYRVLTAEEEIELAKRIEQGDEEAKEQMIKHNLKLVVSVAKRFDRYGIPIEDLIQEGNMGLMVAVEKFDWRKGRKFSTYATHWIRQKIFRYIQNTGRTIRLPFFKYEEIRIMRKKKRELATALGRKPTDEELAREMGVNKEKIEDLKRVSQSIYSLDKILGNKGKDNETLSYYIADDSITDVEVAADAELLREYLGEALAELPERYEAVIRARYGLDDDRPRTLTEIAKVMGVSRQMIHLIEERALKKLRCRNDRLHAFL